MADPLPPLSDSPPPLSPPGKSPFAVWMEKSGTSGKVLMASAGLGVISLFLPAISLGPFGSVACIEGWHGKLGLLCYIAVGVLTLLVYQKAPPQNRGLLYAVLGVVGGAALMALLLLFDVMRLSPGIGVILNLIAAGGAVVGAILKAKEDRLF